MEGPNVKCPNCGGRLEAVGVAVFECAACSATLEQVSGEGRHAGS